MFLRHRPLARLSSGPLSALVSVPVPVSPTTRWQQARFFHPSRPQHSVLESCLHVSNDLFLFVYDTTGLVWGLSSFLTGFVTRLLFASVLIWSQLPTQQYNRMGRNLLLAQEKSSDSSTKLGLRWRQPPRLCRAHNGSTKTKTIE